jgi:hypothetical protein
MKKKSLFFNKKFINKKIYAERPKYKINKKKFIKNIKKYKKI